MCSNTQTVWISPLDRCNICGVPFGDGEGESPVMYDASLAPMGRSVWGNYCADCFNRYDGKIGTGGGQRYELQSQEHGPGALYPVSKFWLKIEG